MVAELLDIEGALDADALKAWQDEYESHERDNSKPNPFMPRVLGELTPFSCLLTR